jgi:hypothetical protein
MKRFLVAAIMITGGHAWSTTPGDFTAKADAFLKKNVINGSVTYAAISKNMKEVEALYADIGAMDIASADAKTKQAFYINAYNIIVIYWVVRHLPLKSPLDNSGFFDKVRHKVAGEEMTLNALEIKKLLLTYKDPRFHFALACAAMSCPPLASFAYTPELLDKQLNDRTTLALNNKEWIRVDAAQKKVELSKIFDWYKNDFAATGKSHIEWINQYRKEKIPANYSVGYYEYNWALNER